MNEYDRAAEALRWVKAADIDLSSARLLFNAEPPLTEPVCYHSQQAAEKAMKAVLVLEGVEIPYIHSLVRIQHLLPGGWLEGHSPQELQRLTRWAAESRYPGEEPAPTIGEAAHALAEAQAVYDSIVGEFSRRGVNFEQA